MTEDKKNTKTEVAPDDTVIRKVLIEEEKEPEKEQTEGFTKMIKPESTIAVIAAGLSLISIIALYCTAYSNQITDCNIILDSIVGVIVGGIFSGIFIAIVGGIFGAIVGVIVGGIFGGIFGGILGGIVGYIVGVIFGCIVGGIFSNIFGSNEKRALILTISFLTIIFLLPFTTMIVPLSKYHNLNQIERDKKIVEILQISAEKHKIIITLPYQSYKEHSYLEKVLSIRKGDEETSWKDIAVPCRKGNEYWYEATFDIALLDKLPADKENKEVLLTLFFDHAWKDYETIKIVF